MLQGLIPEFSDNIRLARIILPRHPMRKFSRWQSPPSGKHRRNATPRPPVRRMNLRGNELAAFPLQAHFISAARAQPGDFPIRPGRGQRRQQDDFTRLRLQQHFGNRGSRAEVPVNLKWRMRVKEVRQRAVGQQRAEQLVRAVTPAEPRPHRQPVGRRPAGAFVAANIQSYFPQAPARPWRPDAFDIPVPSQ